ncbi:glucosaminidase domain-containing protein, partial [Schaalia vaccimaxillae]|uniref:glucosaminidase domain-containing protein n=1 Tax=Schaalia vaccimaxillae TaxID=183916 RepID=UPI0003B6BD77
MTTGWLKEANTWYYLNPSGAMATGTKTINGRVSRFNSSGHWIGYADQHAILATPSASRASLISMMVRAYEKQPGPYPASVMRQGGAGDIRAFAGMIYDEAIAEGVSPELVFCQVMKETAWLQFGGDVKAKQFNFGGIGAVGSTARGASFSSVRIGLRAQVQHLRAYADPNITETKLAHSLVDPRFVYVRKGSAPYIEYLGVQENPSGAGWATAKNYGYDLVSMMNTYF